MIMPRWCGRISRSIQSLQGSILRRLGRAPLIGPAMVRRWHIQRYSKAMAQSPRLAPPVTYSEHLLHRILYDRNPLLKIVSDKLAVRELIRARVGAVYLVPLLGTWDDPSEIAWSNLPASLVLKPNHASGLVSVIHDTRTLNRRAVEETARSWLRRDYFDLALEWGYRGLPRLILAEPLLKGPDGSIPAEVQVMTFHGKATLMRVLTGPKGRATRHANWFDTNGVEQALHSRNIPVGSYKLDRETARTLAELAGRTASGFSHLRVDIYLTDQGPKIGELTAYHASAITEWNDPRYNELLGRCWGNPDEAHRLSTRGTADIFQN